MSSSTRYICYFPNCGKLSVVSRVYEPPRESVHMCQKHLDKWEEPESDSEEDTAGPKCSISHCEETRAGQNNSRCGWHQLHCVEKKCVGHQFESSIYCEKHLVQTNGGRATWKRIMEGEKESLKRKIAELEEKNNNNKDKDEDEDDEEECRRICTVCMDENRGVTIFPCLHTATCYECTWKLPVKKCPICRGPLDGFMRNKYV